VSTQSPQVPAPGTRYSRQQLRRTNFSRGLGRVRRRQQGTPPPPGRTTTFGLAASEAQALGAQTEGMLSCVLLTSLIQGVREVCY
jgi:hypothetical protein